MRAIMNQSFVVSGQGKSAHVRLIVRNLATQALKNHARPSVVSRTAKSSNFRHEAHALSSRAGIIDGGSRSLFALYILQRRVVQSVCGRVDRVIWPLWLHMMLIL